ncbi:DNA/RNA endonuclease G (NUC1) [Gillisia sp. Hel_I_86]|uniref:DNA/RNA non-specific endonuclease n=1 Tax=Gillisia sp. Hel_I_86 TaxID=1249981 RepID=UPI00119C5BFE|nr:DNA/RNA non-specific endonuclease [Gillisia sp. Hel_I_86]TVZ28611.1 DNA/RNA endonuclease G (NUC1) [Gillisia sp. Hel_I_86]
MKNFSLLKWLFAIQFLFILTSCEKDTEFVSPNAEITSYDFTVTAEGNYLENFEGVSKTSYAGASVAFTDGDWYFNDALIGSLKDDRKTDSRSARIRNSGSLTMQFDLVEGAKSISVDYGKFGRDKTSSFEIYYSTDAGASWTKTGSAITVDKTTLKTAIFNLSVSGNVRFEIRKTDGSSNRLNIDNVLVVPNPQAAPPAEGTIVEDYESGSKGSYASGPVTFPSGNWLLTEALVGSLSGDAKTGLKSVRIRDVGSLEMEFDVIGAQNISFNHAVYGTDGASTWDLQVSTDSGASWTTLGATVTSASTSLTNVSYTVNYVDAVRFRIVKLSGNGDRINIDDFTIDGTAVDPGTGGGTGGGGGVPGSGAVHLTMGNPSNAVTDIAFPTNYLLEREEYTMSYSRDKGTANWVSWHLDEAWLGSAARQNDFRADSTIPSGWYQVNQNDYSLSGFDRGHMCPSADRTLSVDDNSNTFFMTNMIPQAPNNNRIGWASLESYCRSMLAGGYEIYIISGGYGLGGDGSNGVASYIANGNVQVPSNTWKVIMVMGDGNDDVNRVTTNTRVIAIDMPNSQSVSSDWTQYKTTVDDIEMKTGYDFFNLVPDNIENVIEARVDAVM